MDKDARAAIEKYLNSVRGYLMFAPEDRREEILGDVEAHIYDALKERAVDREATLQDVMAVLAEMDPPGSYAKAFVNSAPHTPIPACPTNRLGRIPRVLLLGLAALAVIVIMKLLAAAATGDPRVLVGAVLSAVVLIGLYAGSKVAYVITIAGVAYGSIASTVVKGFGMGLATLLLNCLVLIPVLLSTPYFFPTRSAGSHTT